MKKTGYVISIDSKDYMLPMAVAELIESLRQDCDSSRKRIATLEKALTDIKHQTDSAEQFHAQLTAEAK